MQVPPTLPHHHSFIPFLFASSALALFVLGAVVVDRTACRSRPCGSKSKIERERQQLHMGNNKNVHVGVAPNA